MKEILKQQWLAYNHCGPSFGLKQKSPCVQHIKRDLILVSIFWSSWISSRNPAQMWRASMSSKALRFLDLSLPGKGGSKKKAQNVLISFHRENNMVRLRRYTCGRNVLLRSRHSRGRSWVHVFPWLILTACTCGRGKKGNEYEQGGLMSSLLCSSGGTFLLCSSAQTFTAARGVAWLTPSPRFCGVILSLVFSWSYSYAKAICFQWVEQVSSSYFLEG